MTIGKQQPDAKSSAFVYRKNYSWREIDFAALRKEWLRKEKEKEKEKENP